MLRNPSSVRHPPPQTTALTALRLLSSASTIAPTMPSPMAKEAVQIGIGSLPGLLSVPRIVCHRRSVMPQLSLVLTVALGRRQGISSERLRGQLGEKCKCNVMCMCSFLLMLTSYKTVTHICNALVSYPYFQRLAGSANVIVTARMKMRGIVRGVANDSTEMA